MVTLPNWYEDAAVGLPSTNNGVEATNAVIKAEHTLRVRLPIGEFLGCSSDMVRQWSQRRNPKSVNWTFFNETTIISLGPWTKYFL